MADQETYQGAGFAGRRLGEPAPQEISEPGAEPQAGPVTPAQYPTDAVETAPATPVMEGKWRYVKGIPEWQAWPLKMELRSDFLLSSSSLHVTRRGHTFSIPLAAMQRVSFESTFLITYSTPDGAVHVAEFEFPYLWDITRTGRRLLSHLTELGVTDDRAVPAAHGSYGSLALPPTRTRGPTLQEEAPASAAQPDTAGATPSNFHCKSCKAQSQWLADGRLWCPRCQIVLQVPRPGLFSPWYVKEPGPIVVKRYDDRWDGRGDMNRDIREASACGWKVAQTQTIPGHLNAGTLLAAILLFWTVIVPFFALFNLRSTGKFVVTFERTAPSTPPQAQTVTPENAHQPTRPTVDVAEQLQELQDLRDRGLITEDEFEVRRHAVLERQFPVGHEKGGGDGSSRDT
jgi:hypothetical protein